MVEILFRNYLNVYDYAEHPLYKDARARALASVAKKSMTGDRHASYQAYIEGFIEGYLQEIFKGLGVLIRLELEQGTIDLNDIAETYHLSKDEVRYALKEVLNNNV